MVLALKGETALKADGQDYVLVFDIYAVSSLEERLEMSAGEIISKLTQNPPLKFIATVMWSGLQDRHPDLSEKDAMAIISHQKSVAEATMLCIRAIASAFPSAAEEGGDEDPQKAAEPGTGRSSSGSGAGSASGRRTSSGSKPRSSSK